MNKTGAPHGEILGRMKPLSKKSFNCSFNSFNSAGAIWLRGIEIGCVSRKRSISKSLSLSRGILGKSSRNTSGNSFTIEIDSRVGVSKSISSP
ncbi:hypothetical protein R3W88_016227 [Solanum pinnatisectum]|uniref:Uncharacterized protein n=1 Tax=Solanum pinnatisectum TaxID=50273 RepID=A0AAV9KZ75_9SOLN|nr:hypothetical protein R3W88_016227 [Solanum pinnatisectum]